MRSRSRSPILTCCLAVLFFLIVLLPSSKLFASPFFLQFPFNDAAISHPVKTMAYIEENGIWLLDDAGQVSFYDGTYIQSLSDFVPDVPPVSDLGVVDNTLLLLIDKKLHLYDMASGEVTVSYFASGLDINDIEVWSNDLLVASTTGVYRLDLRNERVEHVLDAVLARIYRVDSGFVGDTGSQLIELNSGKTLYRYSGTQPISDVEVWDNKLLVGNNGGIHVIRGDTITQSFFRDERVFAIEKTGEGIWVGTDTGIYLAKSEGEELHFAQMNKTSIDTFSFLGKKVTAFAKGLEGDMWIASDNGLNYRSSILSGLHRLPVGHLNGEMADAGVSSFINGYGNFYISARNKLVKLSNTLEPLKAKTFNFSIQSLAALENTIWVASASGLYAYHPDSLEKQPDALPEPLRNISIDKLLADSHSLWISSENRILRYWPKTQTLIDFDTWWSDSQEARLLSLLDMDEDGIWLGTTHGLIRYFDGSFNNVLSHEEMGAVKALSIGSNDLIWMVASQGVYRYAIDDKAKPVQVLDHSENGRILCASTQNNAITYITTKGVFRNHRGQTLKQSVLTTHLTSQSVRYFCDMSAQATYFAGDLGAFYLSTETLNKLFNLPLRPSFVSTVHVDKQPYRLGPVGESVVVSMPAKSTATIDISQMPFNVREGVTYQLLGSGSDTWHSTKDNHLVFSALDSGDYSLVIKEALQGGIQTERQVFSFVVTRSWYEQLGIFLLGALAIAWLSVFYIQKRTMKRASLAYTFGTPVVDIHQSEELVSAPLDVEKEAREEFVVSEGRLMPEEREASSVEPTEPKQSPQEALIANSVEDKEDSASSDEAWQVSAQTEIDNNFSDPDYSTSMLATALFISERSLQRRFKSVFGYTFKEALISARLENAKTLLAKGEKVSDVSIACGFNEPSYFSKSFKARFGYTPTQYREMTEKEEV